MYGVEDLIVTPYGMVVVGHASGVMGNHTDVVVLATEDGIQYEPVLDPDGVFLNAVQTSGVFLEGSVVMVGHQPYSETNAGIAYQWVWTP
jgi:hypothetical protein